MAQIYFARRRAKWLTFQLRLTTSMMARMKELEAENARLRKMYIDVMTQQNLLRLSG
ncbi:hypothetical protein GCM10009097_60010 [Pigmentiphaga daeguensis]|uniref:Transposase n=1 Tax=Pigmentiphaga daeguensis TaxID=414049 RepID=A0ABN1D6I2_9BURK